MTSLVVGAIALVLLGWRFSSTHGIDANELRTLMLITALAVVAQIVEGVVDWAKARYADDRGTPSSHPEEL
jgi:heme A synthase